MSLKGVGATVIPSFTRCKPSTITLSPACKTGLDHPHVTEVGVQVSRLDCDFVVGTDDSNLIDALQFGNGLLGDQKCAFADFRNRADTRILSGA